MRDKNEKKKYLSKLTELGHCMDNYFQILEKFIK